MTCPGTDTIAELVCRQLGDDDAASIEAHLADCGTCRRLVATLAASSLVRFAAGSDTHAVTTPAARRRSALLRAGAAVGRYRIVELLGAGGMGVVYAARDPELDRSIALKLIRPELAGAEAAALMLTEAQAMARLRHRNVVTVHDVGTCEHGVFVAMELVTGGTLREWLGEPRPWREAIAMLLPAARGLAAAHAAGLVHRDFKPENVLRGDDGEVRVSDFGLARAAGAGADAAGTPAYMAPEQRAGQPPDPRADQYSFCVVLHEALHGARPPVDDGSPTRALRRAPHRPTDGGRARAARIPAWLRRAVETGLARDPADRHPSMDALVDILARDRAATRRRATWAVLVAGGALAVTAAALPSAAEDPCRAAGALPAGIWDGDAASAIGRAFAATAVPDADGTAARVVARLDDWRTRWSDQRVAACRAARVVGVESDDLLDLRMQCLDDRARGVAALVAVMSRADAATVERAVTAVEDASALDRCAGPRDQLERRQPADRATRAAADALATRMTELRAAAATGHTVEATALGDQIAAAAVAAGLPGVAAEAELLVAYGEVDLSRWVPSQARAERALVAAETAGDDRTRARAYLVLATAAGVLDQRDEAQRLVRLARALSVRLDDLELTGAVLATDASVHASSDRSLAALPLLTAALAMSAARHGDTEHTDLADLYAELGGVLDDLGLDTDAAVMFGRAIEIRERLLGERHPSLIAPLSLLGSMALHDGRIADAITMLERAIALRRQVDGEADEGIAPAMLGAALTRAGRVAEGLPLLDGTLRALEAAIGADSPVYAAVLGMRCYARFTAGQHEGALADCARAVAIVEAQLGPSDPFLGTTLEVEGFALLRAGHRRDARDRFRRALAIGPLAMNGDGTDTSGVELGLGLVALAEGRPDRARPHLERSVAMRSAPGADPVDLADSRAALARALVAAGRDRFRALALAQDARAAYVSTGAVVELPALEAWLREHGGQAAADAAR